MFRKLAEAVSSFAGSPIAFFGAFFIIIAWGITGPVFHFSDTWQLVINTGTTIVTFLLGFTIQYTQNRDNRAIHIKIDELLIAVPKAHHREMIDIEKMAEEEIEEVYQKIVKHRGALESR